MGTVKLSEGSLTPLLHTSTTTNTNTSDQDQAEAGQRLGRELLFWLLRKHPNKS